MSRQNLFDPAMTKTLSMGLSMMDVFKPKFGQRKKSSDTAADLLETQGMMALREKVQLSKSPSLHILNVLLADSSLKTMVEEYSGVWMTSLAVVLAAKPRNIKIIPQTIEINNDNHNSNKTASEYIAKESHDDHNSSSSSSSSSISIDIHESDIEARRNSVAVHLSTELEAESDFYDQTRTGQNSEREEILRSMIHLRKQRIHKMKEFLALDELQAFCGIECDGDNTDDTKATHNNAKRLLFEYALQKYSLFQRYKKNEITKDEYDKLFHELQAIHKKNAFDTLNKFKQKRNDVELEYENLSNITRNFCLKHFHRTSNRKTKLMKTMEQPNDDDTTNSLSTFIQKRNLQHNNESFDDSSSSGKHIIDNIDEIKAKEEEKLKNLENILLKQLDEVKQKYNIVESKNSKSKKMNINNDDIFDNDENEAKALDMLHKEITKKNNNFSDKFLGHMSNSAQSSLIALDQRFVQGGVLSEEREELFDELMWNMSERKWETDAAEKSRLSFCRNLVEELDGKLRNINRQVFHYELSRIEAINAFNIEK